MLIFNDLASWPSSKFGPLFVNVTMPAQLMTQDDELELQNGATSECAKSAIEEMKQDLSHRATLRDVTAKN